MTYTEARLVGLLVAVIGSISLVPGVSGADVKPYECGPNTRHGRVCVRALNEDLLILCWVQDTRPTCVGYGATGGQAYSPTGDGVQMHGWGDVLSGPVRLVQTGNFSVPVWQSTYQLESWGIFSHKGSSTKTYQKTFFTPRASGPAGGCLTYRVQLRSHAHASTRTGCFGIQQCINGRTYKIPSQHVHSVSKTHCVEGKSKHPGDDLTSGL